MQQHKYEVWASNLILLAFSLSILNGLLTRTSMFHRGQDLTVEYIKDWGSFLAIYVGLAVTIRKGYKWAKYAYLFYFLITLLVIAFDINSTMKGENTTSPFTLLYVTQYVLSFVIFVMVCLSFNRDKATTARPE